MPETRKKLNKSEREKTCLEEEKEMQKKKLIKNSFDRIYSWQHTLKWHGESFRLWLGWFSQCQMLVYERINSINFSAYMHKYVVCCVNNSNENVNPAI